MALLSDAVQEDAAQTRENASQQARAKIARVLSTGQARLDAELTRLRSLGVVDAHGKLADSALPEDMLPGADRDFGG